MGKQRKPNTPQRRQGRPNTPKPDVKPRQKLTPAKPDVTPRQKRSKPTPPPPESTSSSGSGSSPLDDLRSNMGRVTFRLPRSRRRQRSGGGSPLTFIRDNLGVLVIVVVMVIILLLLVIDLGSRLLTPPQFNIMAGTIAYESDERNTPAIFNWMLEGDVRQVNNNPEGAYHPTFAPNGTTLAFEVHKPGDIDIFAGNAVTGAGVFLVTGAGNDIHPEYSPNGTYLAFVSDRDGGTQSVYVISLGQDRTITRLTDDTGIESDPVWSPDGAQIAFVSEREGISDIYRLDLQTCLTQPECPTTAVTNDPAIDAHPDWSPNRRTILFASTREGGQALYTVNVNNSRIRRVTETSGSDSHPRWAPDGQRILFTSTMNGSEDLYVMRPGRDPIRLTEAPGSERYGVWMPPIEEEP